jgi:hypothetical protein
MAAAASARLENPCAGGRRRLLTRRRNSVSAVQIQTTWLCVLLFWANNLWFRATCRYELFVPRLRSTADWSALLTRNPRIEAQESMKRLPMRLSNHYAPDYFGDHTHRVVQ